MKHCSKCDRDLDESEFAKNSGKKDGLNSNCRSCQKVMKDAHYQKNKQSYIDKAKQTLHKVLKWFDELKATLACVQCGFNHPAALDFHHRNPSEKEVGITHAIRTLKWSKSRVEKEMEKCDVLCSNCHRILHWNERMAR